MRTGRNDCGQRRDRVSSRPSWFPTSDGKGEFILVCNICGYEIKSARYRKFRCPDCNGADCFVTIEESETAVSVPE
jgi:predicted RNA-binding Zn-ribbon protein involved in translation (DUF1610 family)